MESVNMLLFLRLPRRLLQPRDLAFVGEFSEADSAEAELADDAVRTAAAGAAIIFSDLVFLRFLAFGNH
jgi:hypothetical protein